jgi:uncharacterized protein (TIRG00374 family)
MKRLGQIVKPLVSIGFFVVLFLFVQKGELVERLKSIDPLYFALSFLLIPVLICLSCLKWKVLLNHQGHDIPFGHMMRIYMIGYFFSNLLPTVAGGDVVRSYYAGRIIGSQTHAAVSVFIERFSGLLLLLVLGIFAPLLEPSLYRRALVAIPAALAFLLLALVIWIAFIRDPLAWPDAVVRALLNGWRRVNQSLGLVRLNRFVDRIERLYRKAHGILDHFHDKLVVAVNALGANRKTLAAVVLLTLVFYFMTWINVYLAFRAFNVNPDFISMSAVIPTIMLSFLLPVSQGNLGLAEGAYVYYYSLVGIPVASSLAMALFMRFKLFCSGTVGYLFYLTYRKIQPRISDLRASEKIDVPPGTGPSV